VPFDGDLEAPLAPGAAIQAQIMDTLEHIARLRLDEAGNLTIPLACSPTLRDALVCHLPESYRRGGHFAIDRFRQVALCDQSRNAATRKTTGERQPGQRLACRPDNIDH